MRILLLIVLVLTAILLASCGDTNREGAMKQDELKALSLEVMSPIEETERSVVSDSTSLASDSLITEKGAE